MTVPVRDSPVRRPVTTAQVLTVDDGVATPRRDQLATEEPMEIRVQGPGQDPAPFAVAMRMYETHPASARADIGN